MAFFDDLTTSLKQKWLQFFQDNRSWITLQMDVESVYTPDGGRRPSSYLILGVINALEANLAQLMLPFSKLNSDADALIDVLELNFDPELVLGYRFNPQAVLDELSDQLSQMSDAEVAPMLQQPNYNITVIEALTDIDPAELSDMSLSEMADEVVLVESDFDEEPILVVSAAEAEAFGDMSIEEIADAIGLNESDDESPETPNAAQPDELGDVLSDVWDEGTSSESEQADNETRLGDKKQSEHDQEISRLFPNS